MAVGRFNHFNRLFITQINLKGTYYYIDNEKMYYAFNTSMNNNYKY